MTDSALFFTNGGIALTAIWYQGQLAVFCCNLIFDGGNLWLDRGVARDGEQVSLKSSTGNK